MKNHGDKPIKLIEHGKTNYNVRIRKVNFFFLSILIEQFWLGITINPEMNISMKHIGAI
ncbi:hypothetical protein [Caldiplasma sukawensis]